MKKDLPGWLWISFAVVGMISLGIVDWITGYDLNFSYSTLCLYPLQLGLWVVVLLCF